MKPKIKKAVQAALLVAMLAAGVRLALIYQQRRAAEQPAEPRAEAPLHPDFYVTPRKLYLHDVESAQKALAGQTVWIREGYRYTFYATAGGRADFSREAGLLPPLARLEVRRVVLQPSPRGAGEQVVAVFEREGAAYALPIGVRSEGSYQMYADELFFYDDPREMYRHWPEDVWQAVARGEVQRGMSEMQAAFAAGVGVPQESDPEIRIVRYPRGELKPLTVWFRNNRVVDVVEGE
jgi:hypothetical protein